jgi:hypothetical protein
VQQSWQGRAAGLQKYAGEGGRPPKICRGGQQGSEETHLGLGNRQGGAEGSIFSLWLTRTPYGYLRTVKSINFLTTRPTGENKQGVKGIKALILKTRIIYICTNFPIVFSIWIFQS